MGNEIHETPQMCLCDITRNMTATLEGILINREPTKEQAKRIEHRVRGFLQCLESLRLELEVRESERPASGNKGDNRDSGSAV